MRKFMGVSFILLITIILCVGTNKEVASMQEDRFPSKPIKFIIREGPGGTTDLAYRALTGAAEKILGQQIICNNIPGGGGTRALAAILQEKPDGYALGTLTMGTLVLAHVEKLNFFHS